MFKPIKMVDIEMSHPITDIRGLDGYIALQVLVRLHGAPIEYVRVPVTEGQCAAVDLAKNILEKHSWAIMRHFLCDSLAETGQPNLLTIEDLIRVQHPWNHHRLSPLVTAAICTRDRIDDLSLCLDSMNHLDYPNLDILVVDNAPSSDGTERLVRNTYPNVRYVREPRPGLNWARNRAIQEAKGEIIAYADDDVVVDPGWVQALAAAFVENPEVMAVTGLVVPYELETEAQLLFEQRGGFGKGFHRIWFDAMDQQNRPVAHRFGGAGQFGTGANMAYRRNLFDQIGYFDPALDVGTPTNGGGDLDMFFRVFKEGHTLIYEPGAIVRHRHRRSYAELRSQMANWGIGFYSYLVRNALAYPDERAAFIRLGVWWFWRRNIRRLLTSLIRPPSVPRDLMIAEMLGSLIGLGRYRKASQIAADIVKKYGPPKGPIQVEKRIAEKAQSGRGKAMALRYMDLSQPLSPLSDVADYSTVRLFLSRKGHPIGSLDIANCFQTVSTMRLREDIVNHFMPKLLEGDHTNNQRYLRQEVYAVLSRHYMPVGIKEKEYNGLRLNAGVPVSVVVATYDRPGDLRECVSCLIAQQSPRQIEIIVVDNHPDSGQTPPVVSEFPGVKLVNEPRKGLSYARNAGIVASKGDIIIATDDDVTMLPEWLEKLAAPFARADVMVVTGNVLPFELETEAQQLFEAYGGLGRGFERREVGRDWFDSFRRRAVPTWTLGATANAAFRASIFAHPEIGMIDEALGAGTPTGCSEDTYVFYRVLKAGYVITYEPDAYVWHKHRRDTSVFRHQIYSYSKGHVAYHLTTLLRDHDLRALVRLGFELPVLTVRRIRQRLRGKSIYPVHLILCEVLGSLVGPFSLLRSRYRVKRHGRSRQYVPPEQRAGATADSGLKSIREPRFG